MTVDSTPGRWQQWQGWWQLWGKRLVSL